MSSLPGIGAIPGSPGVKPCKPHPHPTKLLRIHWVRCYNGHQCQRPGELLSPGRPTAGVDPQSVPNLASLQHHPSSTSTASWALQLGVFSLQPVPIHDFILGRSQNSMCWKRVWLPLTVMIPTWPRNWYPKHGAASDYLQMH